MIKINRIEPQVVELFNPEDISMGFINEYEFNDICIQIKQQKLDGYYCIYNNEIFRINNDGRSNDWFEGFFDTIEKQYSKLL